MDIAPLLGAAKQPAGDGMIVITLYIVIMAITWWVLAVRPKTIQEKKQRETIAKLKKSDPVMLESGIYGEVDRVENDFIMVKIADKTVIKVHSRGVRSIASETNTDSKEVKK